MELEALVPHLRYDSQESFRAASAALITDAPQNALCRKDGSVLARAGDVPPLGLGLLGLTLYADGTRVEADDYLDEVGRDYVEDVRRLQEDPVYADRVYGHVAVDRAGATWLQYWFFYYYNDKSFLGIGLHEGDWEMVQFRIAGEEPDVVTFAQHAGGERCAWHEVDLREGAPVVYVALGSHASLLRAGRHPAPVVPDRCDARGPLVRPALEMLGDKDPPWSAWPGFWGSTKARSVVESTSPRGPSRHEQWRDPLLLHDTARDCRTGRALAAAEATRPVPAAPRLHAWTEEERVAIAYRLPPSALPLETAVRLIVSAGPPTAAPVTRAFDVRTLDGVVELPHPDAGRPLVLRTSAANAAGATGPVATVRVALTGR